MTAHIILFWTCCAAITSSLVHAAAHIYTTIVPPITYPHYHLYIHANRSFVPHYLQLSAKAPSLNAGLPTTVTKDATKIRSYSQSKMDVAVLDVLKGMEKGYFVDLAASHFRDISNTYMLEQHYLWTGVCIEPDPMYWSGHLENRRCQLYVNPVTGTAGDIVPFRFQHIYGGIVGSEFEQQPTKGRAKANTTDTVDMVTTTLTLILDDAKAPKTIHYMSLDIEGAEYLAMSSFDFRKYTILVMTVERPKTKLHHLLAKNGFVYIKQLNNVGEFLYVHYSLPDFTNTYVRLVDTHVPIVNKAPREDLLQPTWRGDVAKYLEDANALYAKSHPIKTHRPATAPPTNAKKPVAVNGKQ